MMELDYTAPVERHHNIKRLINISDTHFGVRSNSVEWMEIQQQYFFDWFIPLIKKNYREGDAIIHTGDVFDSRQSLNLKVLNMGLDIFSALSEIMPVFIICGNHDIYHKKTNEINSLRPFTYIKNIHVYEDPVILELNGGDTRALLMPWQDTKEQEQSVIDANDADYLFCHTDISGLKFNKFVSVDEGVNAEVMNKFKMVYSGHIHYTQKRGNIRMVGCPYQLTRSDVGNTKNVWYIDLETNKETGIENDYSPKFVRMNLDSILELRYGYIKDLIDNNFVDILVHSSWATNFPFNDFLEAFNDVKYRKMNYVITTLGEGDELDLDTEHAYENDVALPMLIDMYIDNMTYNDNTKDKLKDAAKKLYYDIMHAEEQS